MSLIRGDRVLGALIVLGVAVLPGRAQAEKERLSSEQVDAAEEAFDLGVKHFESHNYAASARAFLRADALRPDTDTMTNALTAAKKSRDHLLTVEVARRALDRKQDSPGLESAAREALAVSGPHLAQLELRCMGDCTLLIDGEETSGQNIWLNPGTHRLSAYFPRSGRSNTKTVTLAEGANYSFKLDELEEDKSQAGPSDGAPASATKSSPASPAAASEPAPEHKPVGWADEGVFIAGVGATLGLVGATVWSGLDAMRAQSRLTSTSGSRELDPVHNKIRRTDALLGASIGTAALSTIWAIWGVDFETRSEAVSAAVGLDYAGVIYGGRF